MKKTKQILPIKTRYEHLAINHNNIRVDIVVDYVNMQVSLVDKNREKRSYMFCERSLNYEQWRYNILEAIQEAMKIWFDKLRIRKEEDYIDCAEKIIALQ